MTNHIRRREFIALLGGAAAAWPLAAGAQQPRRVARIGFLGVSSQTGLADKVEGFRLGLRELGYVEGTNLIIEYRYADGNYQRLAALADELVGSNVDVIVTNSSPGGLAAKRATSTIPIVMAVVGDAVAIGLVPSLARPEGNITGQSFLHLNSALSASS